VPPEDLPIEDGPAPGEPGARVEVVDDGGRPALAIDGAIQSVGLDAGGAAGGYWAAMLPDRTPRDALLLGLGGGTIAHLLVSAFGPLPIVGVDDDPAVLALGRAAFGLDLPNLEVVLADAFGYVAECRRSFDFVCVDLYRDGHIPARVCAPRFLADVERVLRPDGTLTLNLARDRLAGDRLRRIERRFAVVKRILVGFNLVVHCVRRPPTFEAEAGGRAGRRAAGTPNRKPARGGKRAGRRGRGWHGFC
jgi:spermidine synthase